MLKNKLSEIFKKSSGWIFKRFLINLFFSLAIEVGKDTQDGLARCKIDYQIQPRSLENLLSWMASYCCLETSLTPICDRICCNFALLERSG